MAYHDIRHQIPTSVVVSLEANHYTNQILKELDEKFDVEQITTPYQSHFEVRLCEGMTWDPSDSKSRVSPIFMDNAIVIYNCPVLYDFVSYNICCTTFDQHGKRVLRYHSHTASPIPKTPTMLQHRMFRYVTTNMIEFKKSLAILWKDCTYANARTHVASALRDSFDVDPAIKFYFHTEVLCNLTPKMYPENIALRIRHSDLAQTDPCSLRYVSQNCPEKLCMAKMCEYRLDPLPGTIKTFDMLPDLDFEYVRKFYRSAHAQANEQMYCAAAIYHFIQKSENGDTASFKEDAIRYAQLVYHDYLEESADLALKMDRLVDYMTKRKREHGEMTQAIYDRTRENCLEAYADLLMGDVIAEPTDSSNELVQKWEDHCADVMICANMKQIMINRASEGGVFSPGDVDGACEEQAYALRLHEAVPIVYIGGPGGSGKTELLNRIAKHRGHESTLVLAFTSSVSALLTKRVGMKAFTCHQYVVKHAYCCPKSKLYTGNGAVCPAKGITTVIFDEMSVMYPQLFAGVLQSLVQCGSLSSLVMSGDWRQMPPVKPGNIIIDMLRSVNTACVDFVHNHRVAESNKILRENSELIAKGCGHEVRYDDETFRLFQPPIKQTMAHCLENVLKILDPVENETHIIARTNILCRELCPVIEKHFRGSESDARIIHLGTKFVFKIHVGSANIHNNEILVLTKVYSIVNNTNRGVTLLTKLESANLAPNRSVEMLSLLDADTRLGEREKSVYIHDALATTGEPMRTKVIMCKDYSGEERVYLLNNEMLKSIKKAYCTTIYSFQGSQVPTIIIVEKPPRFQGGSESMYITREPLYTSVTRGSERVVLVMDSGAVGRISSKPSTPRLTALHAMISATFGPQLEKMASGVSRPSFLGRAAEAQIAFTLKHEKNTFKQRAPMIEQISEEQQKEEDELLMMIL
jgi:hypothetical protein